MRLIVVQNFHTKDSRVQSQLSDNCLRLTILLSTNHVHPLAHSTPECTRLMIGRVEIIPGTVSFIRKNQKLLCE